MIKMRMAILGFATVQAVFWIIIIFIPGGYVQERIEGVAMIAAAVLAAVAAMKSNWSLVTVAQIGQIATVAIYIIVSILWAMTNPEVKLGIGMMISSGMILLVVVPPFANLVMLQFLNDNRLAAD